MTEFLTAAQAAQRLGVKPATLYAYVSRGVLRRDHAADGRSSLFDSEEGEQLARRVPPPPAQPQHRDRPRAPPVARAGAVAGDARSTGRGPGRAGRAARR